MRDDSPVIYIRFSRLVISFSLSLSFLLLWYPLCSKLLLFVAIQPLHRDRLRPEMKSPLQSLGTPQQSPELLVGDRRSKA